MNITLKQSDIEAAIRQYTERQGISLRSKTMKIEFTSGRKNNGVSATLSIEDIDIPGDTDFVQRDPATKTVEGPGVDFAATNSALAAHGGKVVEATAVHSEDITPNQVGGAPVEVVTEGATPTPVAETKPAEEVPAAVETVVADTPVEAAPKTVASLFGTP